MEARRVVPLVEARNIWKRYGAVQALSAASISVEAGRVVGLLGDNGAGKSTLIKILSGLHQPDEGQIFVGGEPVHFRSTHDARAYRIATVYQDLALIDMLPVVRNFFLGHEPSSGRALHRPIDWTEAGRIVIRELARFDIHVSDPDLPIGAFSGGERQTFAIARAMYFGASVLILDEPTSALGVKEALLVLGQLRRACDAGVGVVLITHNLNHAYIVCDKFTILVRGEHRGDFERDAISRDDVQWLMAGGEDITELEAALHKGRIGRN